MTTIDEADVIRIIKDNPRLVFNAMREDPELLKEVRQAILTDELLELPRQFARMSDTLETLVGVVSDTNARVERVESMVERIPPLEARVDRVEALLGYLVGSELERKMGTAVPNRLEAVYQVEVIPVAIGYAILNDAREYNDREQGGRARIFEMRRRNR